MKKNAMKIIEELTGDNKERVMFYIDPQIQVDFKKVCQEQKIRMSAVVEKLINNFLNEVNDMEVKKRK